MIRVLSWNVRGLNDSAKRASLRNSLRDWNCDLVCLQETKLGDIELSDVRSIWGIQHVGFSVTLHLISSSSGEFSVTCFLQMRDGSPSWAFTGVYGPQARVDKLRMLEELGRVRDAWPRDGWPGPLVFRGGF